jgi:LmbE family N-acetylglucosaminyl deacetylase
MTIENVTEGTSLFVSPHLDDAVLSCGALISHLAASTSVIVATVFTADAPGPHTLSARAFLRQCGSRDAAQLFHVRQAEDYAVVQRAGALPVHLGFSDALFRRRPAGAGWSWTARLIPEFSHMYPTYRFHIGRGQISQFDEVTITDALAAINGLARSMVVDSVFFPLAIGLHVDHVICRTIGDRFQGNKIFYADFPYLLSATPDADFIRERGLVETEWSKGVEHKGDLISGYVSQMPGLFPTGAIPSVAERYFTTPGQL